MQVFSASHKLDLMFQFKTTVCNLTSKNKKYVDMLIKKEDNGEEKIV